MDWTTLLAYISGSVDEELLLRNEYLVAENRILRDQIKERIQLSDAERQTLADIGKKLGKQALQQFPLYPKDPIRPMSAGSLGAHVVPHLSRLTPSAQRESKRGSIPRHF